MWNFLVKLERLVLRFKNTVQKKYLVHWQALYLALLLFTTYQLPSHPYTVQWFVSSGSCHHPERTLVRSLRAGNSKILEPIHKLHLVIEFVMNESRQEMELSNDLIWTCNYISELCLISTFREFSNCHPKLILGSRPALIQIYLTWKCWKILVVQVWLRLLLPVVRMKIRLPTSFMIMQIMCLSVSNRSSLQVRSRCHTVW